MQKISYRLADVILNSRNENGKCDFGYICDYGAIVEAAEFSVYENEHRDYFLVHKSELEKEGPFVRIKVKK